MWYLQVILLDMYELRSTHVHTSYDPEAQTFCTFPFMHAMMSHFQVIVKFTEKSTKWPQNDLELFKVKSTPYAFHIHHLGQNFVFVSLCDEPFLSWN